MRPGTPILEATAITVAPPGTAEPILRNCSLHLAPGEWVAITGPNGCGKSTLALALAGLWSVRSGRVERGRRETGGDARVVTVLQEPASQIVCSTVAEEVEFVATNLGLELEPDRIEALVTALGLDSFMERDPRLLSAGEQQRVLLASALAGAPDILVADEATAHVDRDARSSCLDLVRDRVRDGLSVLWVTQDRAELAWADRWIDVDAAGEFVERPIERPRAGDVEPAVGDPGIGAVNPMDSPSDRAGTWAQIKPVLSAAARRIRLDVELWLPLDRPGVIAITGPNGSGKSSVLAALAGIEVVPGVVVDGIGEGGIYWRSDSRGTSQGLGGPGPYLVEQYPERQIFADTVGDELLFAATRRGRPREAVTAEALEALSQLGFGPDFLMRRTWSLSAGEKRLVAVVAGLLAPASRLLLDEPICGIDPIRRAVLARRVRDRGVRCPVFVATHDLSWARQAGANEVCLDHRRGPGSQRLFEKRPRLGQKRIDRTL